MTKANERREDAEKLKIKLAEKDVVLIERKKNVENELSEIQPMVDEAKSAVGRIRKDSLNELRMMRLPPEAINDVLSGVLILMGNFDTSWHSMKSFLAKPSVKDEIMNYDARRITPQIRKKANQLLRDKATSFEPKRIQRVSVAAAPLAAWFRANVSYSVILEKIAPLENELRDAEDDINEALAAQNEVEEELVALDEQVSSLKLNFSRITSEAEALKISLKNVQSTLERAQTLLQKLSDEKNRWDEQVNEIAKVTVSLPSYCLLVANFVTYLGGYPENIRVECMNKWKEKIIPNDNSWNVLRFMNNESDLLQWKAQGLPDDELSYQNAMIILNSSLFPFIIDPNGDATKWLTNYLKSHKISHEVIQQTDARFIKQLELSVRFGKTLLVTDVDNINPCLYPLLRRDITKQGARQVISVGDKFIDYNENFKLYLITNNSNFPLPSRCKPLVTELNFCVTRSGLESQILAITLRSEQPELEKKKSALLQEEETYKVQLAELEKELLEQLAMSKGNILENVSLIESLNNTKIQSQNIKMALKESHVVQNDLNQQREIYRVLAVIGSNAYFTIKSLQSLNNMYKFSLSTFLSLFQSNLVQNESGESSNDDVKATKRHIKVLEQQFVASIYRYVSRSLFKSDRLTFGLYLVHSLYPNICNGNEWEYFVDEMILSSPLSSPANKNMIIPSWIKVDIADAFKSFCGRFADLASKCEFKKFSNEWSYWRRSDEPESTLDTHVLSKLSLSITDFQKLLLIQTLRKDRLSIATNMFVQKYLNLNIKSTANNMNASLKDLYEKETCSQTPILFVTTPGADPSTELRELALNIVGKENYNEMAMGSGQQYDAINLIKIGSEKGHWICLKNLHLVIPWIKELQQLLSSLDHHDGFRLWLTTESHAHFPSILLRRSLKITCEPPPGLKQNLTRTLSLWSDEYMAKHDNPIRSQLLFILSWFHGIIQERRTYIPCGWNKYYEFNEADLRASMDIIDSIFDEAQNNISTGAQIPWRLLWGLLSLAIYGGRIDNDIDFETMDSYLNAYFNAKIICSNQSKNSSHIQSIPGAKWLQHIPHSTQKYEYFNLIKTIPDSDSPHIFGLPLNANNIVSLQNVKQLLQRLKLLSVVHVIDDNAALMDEVSQFRQTQQKRMEPIINLWKELQATDKNVKMNGIKNMNPIVNAISLEIEKVSNLVVCINKSLNKMEKALFGNGSLNVELMEDVKEIISGIVPWRWNKLWNKGQGPSNPQIFLSELMKRKQVLNEWMMHLEKETFWKLNVVIGFCFYPMTFLNAFKQHTAHTLNVTMDDLQFECVWNKSLLKKVNSPILNVDGMYIQGALFDGQNFNAVSSKDSALSKAPICYIYYCQNKKEEKKDKMEQTSLKIPVYYSLDRSYKVCDVRINVQDKLKWNLSGLAFIMTNSY